MPLPVNTLVFSGFGDQTQFRFYSPAGVNLGQPPSNPTFVANGATNGMATFADGSILQEGYPQVDQIGPRIWSSDFSTFADFTQPASGVTTSGCCDGVGNAYYVAKASTTVKIIKLNASSIVQLWTFTISGSHASPSIAVNQAGTVAYVGTNIATNIIGETLTIYRIDLTTGAVTTFATTTRASSGNTLFRMLCLGDDTLVVGWSDRTAAGAPVRYATNGSILHTYSEFLGTMFSSGYSMATVMAHAYTAGSGVRPIDSSKFFIGYYRYGTTNPSGVGISTVDVATGAESDLFEPTDGSFEFDSAFTALRLAIADVAVLVTPPPVLVNSHSCCEDPDAPVETHPGNVVPVVSPVWSALCEGGGVVPSVADIVPAEAWDY
jgi:hypothetical protein